MSATKQNQSQPPPEKKKFGKEQRLVPHPSQKASKWYPAEDQRQPKKARKAIRPTKLRPSLQPGTIVIILAGRFRGKRVVILKHLGEGTLLITGPFKINGVPLRRVNARYVIATSTKIDLKGLDQKTLDNISKPNYFTKDKKEQQAKTEEAFFKQGEKPEKKKPTSARAADQKTIDKSIVSTIKKEKFLSSYLASGNYGGPGKHDLGRVKREKALAKEVEGLEPEAEIRGCSSTVENLFKSESVKRRIEQARLKLG